MKVVKKAYQDLVQAFTVTPELVGHTINDTVPTFETVSLQKTW